MHHFDSATFGNPRADLKQTTSQQFSRLVNDVGRGRYKSYNPTAPVPVELTYEFTGPQLAQFRLDWENIGKFNYGANWFTVDLPLMLDHSGEADLILFTPDPEPETSFLFSVQVERNDSPGYTSPIYTTNSYGSLSPSVIFGQNVGQFHFDASGIFYLSFDGIDAGKTNVLKFNDADLEMHVPATKEVYPLVYSDSLVLYSSGGFTNTYALWSTLPKDPQLVEIKVRTQPFQRYRAHVRDPYTARMAGYDYWHVSIPVEVDVSPALVLGGTP